jgi:hypothetical protein
MLHPTISAELARERQSDLLRNAEHDRRVQAAGAAVRASDSARPPVTFWQHRRRRLGLVLVAWGTRLLCVPDQP